MSKVEGVHPLTAVESSGVEEADSHFLGQNTALAYRPPDVVVTLTNGLCLDFRNVDRKTNCLAQKSNLVGLVNGRVQLNVPELQIDLHHLHLERSVVFIARLQQDSIAAFVQRNFQPSLWWPKL